ncbi:mediator complex, subunit Med18 [Trichoderma novae-zelandiae]
MYELFLTALVEDSDINTALAVLSGFCSMQPWESTSRVLYFQGPPRPSGITNQRSLEKPIRKDVALLWKELHQNLSRQSFVLQARYEILKDRDLGPSAEPVDLDTVPGILRWTDFPDPPRNQPILAQRKKVELWDQKKLLSVLQENNHQLKTETIEEMYRFFRDDVEFCLTRHYFVGPLENYVPLASKPAAPTAPKPTLPAWDSLTRVDAQNRWILQVKAHVVQDNKPDEIKKAQDQLLRFRADLEGVFDFKVFDRRVHDTRVAMHPQGVQALPQKVLLGKS